MSQEKQSPRISLSQIRSPEDIRHLELEGLCALAEEIRAEIVRVVTSNGGHLASSLGAVELILALHYVFDTPRDSLIFDVGHQSYAHKLITGRAGRFQGLRLEGGISGFPLREESPYDVFGAGHASTSISAALGLCAARDLAGEDSKSVLAVIGDGALTGGLAMEALNHAGGLQKNLLVVLNDNRMSISPNVGALSQYLSLKLTTPVHLSIREGVKKALEKIMPKKGQRLIRRIQGLEEAMKAFLLSPTAFLAGWGFKYLGPIEGHDLAKLIQALRHVRRLKRPVLLHVMTTKGKGYAPAEEDPLAFHGLGRAKKIPASQNGQPEAVPPKAVAESPAPPKEGEGAEPAAYTSVFGKFMVRKAASDKRLCAITAAMSQGTGLDEFFAAFPDRAFDVAIAEGHAVTFAAGLAAGGFRPVVAIYSTFLQRAFDQIFHDVALQNLPVLLAVDRAGLVGEDGATHHGGLDLSYLRLMPNFTVMAPRDGLELPAMLEMALGLPGPSAVRYPRGPVPAREGPLPSPLEYGRAELLSEGDDLTIAAIGQTVYPALEAAGRLKEKGFSVGVINMRFIKPLDRELLLKEAGKSGKLLCAEENSVSGGLFGAVSECLAQEGRRACRVKALGFGEAPVPQATQAQQRARLGLDAPGIERAALALLQDI